MLFYVNAVKLEHLFFNYTMCAFYFSLLNYFVVLKTREQQLSKVQSPIIKKKLPKDF